MAKKQLTEPHSFDEGRRVSCRFGFLDANANPWADGGEKWQALYNSSTESAALSMRDIKSLYEYFTLAFTEDELTTFCKILSELFDGVLRRDFNGIFERSSALEQHVANCIARHIAIDAITDSNHRV